MRRPSNIAACATPDPVHDIIARYDARAAQNLKLETGQATRAPVIEHVKASPAGAYAGPKRKRKAKYDAQTVGLKLCQSSASSCKVERNEPRFAECVNFFFLRNLREDISIEYLRKVDKNMIASGQQMDVMRWS